MSGAGKNLCLLVMEHEDIQPYRCQLCDFGCTQLSDLEAHLTDKHQVRICSEASLSSPPHWLIAANDLLSLFMNDCRGSSECVAAHIFVQVVRNHELVSQLVLQQETSISKVSVEPRAGTQDYSSENLDVTMHDREAKSQGEDGIRCPTDRWA